MSGDGAPDTFYVLASSAREAEILGRLWSGNELTNEQKITLRGVFIFPTLQACRDAKYSIAHKIYENGKREVG